jgi:UDP-glucose 4-epimerase
MKIFVTGGAGFIGRWVVKKLLEDHHCVYVYDNLSNGREDNIAEFRSNISFHFIKGDIKDAAALHNAFSMDDFTLCYHLAASINVQDSLDNPLTTFNNDVTGTLNVLEECRAKMIKMVYMSTCMVYDRSNDQAGIGEEHRVKPASPYAGSKLAGENIALSYWYGYGLPVVIIRPFNTYGPFQKTGGEGGVVAIFLKRDLQGKTLDIYGDGRQTRDLLYVEDCAEFVVNAGYDDAVNGQVVNAGLGRDISINDLAEHICQDKTRINHIPHIHPQSEIMKLLCDASKALKLLGWKPKFTLEEGMRKTRDWIAQNDKLI